MQKALSEHRPGIVELYTEWVTRVKCVSDASDILLLIDTERDLINRYAFVYA